MTHDSILAEKRGSYGKFGACLIWNVAQPQLRHLTVCILNAGT